MRSSKFLVSFCLIAVLVLCLVAVMPTMAFADEGVTPEDGDISVTIPGASEPDEDISDSGNCGENLLWSLSNSGTLTIRGTGAMDNYMETPAPWAQYADSIKTVTIRKYSTDNITSIGDNAFAGCSNLLRITIPNTVTSIGYSAFESCYGLVEVDLPESIASIGMNAFAYSSLIDCTIPEGVSAIEYGTFKGCAELESVSIPSSIKRIEAYAFDGCTNLQEVCVYGENALNTMFEIVANGNDAFLDAAMKIMVDDGWYFISELNAWIYIKDYVPATGWQLIGNKWYFFDETGIMQTGWLQQGNTWYYLNASGAMATGWLQLGNTWYFFNASGAMATGWIQSGGKWYYFGSSGAMVTGWLKSGNTWYYFNASGAMATGWLKLGGTWYYFNTSGAMVTGSLKIGSKTYRFNSSGACLNP